MISQKQLPSCPLQSPASFSSPAPPYPTKSSMTSRPIHQGPVACHGRHMWIITGPAGCGKSTVAEHLAGKLSLPYIEGDDYHPPANVQKMAAGIPLDDSDRWDWLNALRKEAMARLLPSTSQPNNAVVLTCSALKRAYRDVIRKASAPNLPSDFTADVHFIYLRADQATLMRRVHERKGHYMKDGMVKSQFSSLEEPDADEDDCWIVDAGDVGMEGVLARVDMAVEKEMGQSD